MIINITAKPGSSMNNKTGSWRTDVKPKFLQKTCIACRQCYLICPEGCIDGKEKNTFRCDYAYCKGCGNCAAICPVNDIEMVPEAYDLEKNGFPCFDSRKTNKGK